MSMSASKSQSGNGRLSGSQNADNQRAKMNKAPEPAGSVGKVTSSSVKPTSRWGKGPPASLLNAVPSSTTAGGAPSSTAGTVRRNVNDNAQPLKVPPPGSVTTSTDTSTPQNGTSVVDRLEFVLAIYTGQMIQISTDKQTHRGILVGSRTKPKLSIELAYVHEPGHSDGRDRQPCWIDFSDINEIKLPSQNINKQIKLLESAALDNPSRAISSNGVSRKKEGDAFRTDADISTSGGTLSPPATSNGRDLQKWTFDHDGSTMAATGVNQDDTFDVESRSRKGGAWDQFSANESKFGVKSDYHEDLYTTKLDRTRPDFAERAKLASKLEREILSGSTDNTHIKEEREGAELNPEGDVADATQDEETRYSEVIRPAGSGAYVHPAKRAALASVLGSGKLSSKVSSASQGTDVTSLLGADPAVVDARKAIPGQGTESSFTPKLLGQYRAFANGEKERLASKKHEITQKHRDGTMKELIDFSKHFQLKTDMPDDLKGLLKDKDKNTDAARAKTNPPSTAISEARQETTSLSNVAAQGRKDAHESVNQDHAQMALESSRADILKPNVLKADAKAFSFKPTASAFVPGSKKPEVSPSVSSVSNVESTISPATSLHPFFGLRPPPKPSPSDKQELDIRGHFNLFKASTPGGFSIPDPRTVVPDHPAAPESKGYRAHFQTAINAPFRHGPLSPQTFPYGSNYTGRQPSFNNYSLPMGSSAGQGDEIASQPGYELGNAYMNVGGGMMQPNSMAQYNPASVNYRMANQYGGWIGPQMQNFPGSEYSYPGSGMNPFMPTNYMGNPGQYRTASYTGQFPQQYMTQGAQTSGPDASQGSAPGSQSNFSPSSQSSRPEYYNGSTRGVTPTDKLPSTPVPRTSGNAAQQARPRPRSPAAVDSSNLSSGIAAAQQTT